MSRPKSKYQAKGKKAHKYSEAYQAWHRAVLDQHHDEAARLGKRHSAFHGLRLLKPNGAPVRG